MGANARAEERSISKLQILWALAIVMLVYVASSRERVAGPSIVNADKMAHFAVYGLIATLVCRVGTGWRAAAWALIATSAYGAADEWHQSFVPGRSSEFADWVADTSGAALAVSLYAGCRMYRELLEKPLHWRRRNAAEKSSPEISPP